MISESNILCKLMKIANLHHFTILLENSGLYSPGMNGVPELSRPSAGGAEENQA